MASDRVWGARFPRQFLPAGVEWWPGERDGADWSLRAHPPGHAASEGWGGRGYLELRLRDRMTAELGRYNHAGTRQDWYEVLRPDVPLKVSVRIRGERPGRARLRVAGQLEPAIRPVLIDYGTDWTLVEAELPVPQLLERATPVGRIELVVQGPGRVDVDDLRVHRADAPWLGLAPEDRARLEAAGLSALRTHGWIKTGTDTYDMAELLGGDFAGMDTGLGRFLETLASLGEGGEGGPAPWLQIEPHMSDDEWLALVEYLAAPAPPPGEAAARPWAALRASQGRVAPWTEAWDRIHLELGNETWNGLFRPWTFEGMRDAATGEGLSPGAVYGLFQARVAEVMRSSPWWEAAGMEEKVVWVIGGRNRFPYGAEAVAAAPGASDLMAVADYNGGWDSGEGPPRPDPASFANLLSDVTQSIGVHSVAQAEMVAEIARDQGRAIAVGTYEAGPGYALDGLNGDRVTPEQAAGQERVMKSAAAGVATLDAFLARRGAGFGMQNFFTFGEGTYWKSHAPWHEGGAPYASWAWLALMNELGWGEALAVRTLGAPRADLEGFGFREDVDDAPLVAVHALHVPSDGDGDGDGDGNGAGGRLIVAAISRRVPGHADGAPGSDGAGGPQDGCAPVEISLPLEGRGALADWRDLRSVTLWRSRGAHDAHGATGDPPRIARRTIDPAALADGVLRIGGGSAGGEPCGLPAASAFVYAIDLPRSRP